MSKKGIIQLQGVIKDAHRDTNFIVELENGYQIIAYVCGKIRTLKKRIIVGDKVKIELSVHDKNRGRIIERLK